MSLTAHQAIAPGSPYPLGATVQPGGVNFALFSAHATAVSLLLFDAPDQPVPTREIALDPAVNKTYYYWHCLVPGIGDGQLYGYRVAGPYAPERGLRFNAHKVLVDPYARAVAYGPNWDRRQAYGLADNVASALKSAVVDTSDYDWEGDCPLNRPLEESVLYELHVGGLTRHLNAASGCPGTYLGLIDKLPYLAELGITAIELLPVQQFDPQEVLRVNPLTNERLSNYWGYAPVAYFAPHRGYVCGARARDAVDEFRDMVKACHRAGIEVIVDVVFNHTAEGAEDGPTISFRGLENGAYYILRPDKGGYLDFTGTGNTVNCNHSIVRRLIRECLRYWVQELHVDGFRLDLASVLSRDPTGEVLRESPSLWEIESDPVLAGTKLIAEAWDASGLYQLGAFTGDRWAEWNGRFRDDVRRFVRGDLNTARDLAWRLTGSFDVFRRKTSYTSCRSVNYITCHDGFTLADLVSYNHKHNVANGEDNRDGMDENYAWNCGAEGPTEDLTIQQLRQCQVRNLLTLLMLARGTPLLMAGDELGRTQRGNNNAYCQDNELSWVDWRGLQSHAPLHRFARGLIHLRRRHPTFWQAHSLGERPFDQALADQVTFHGVTLGEPDWSYYSHSLAAHWQAAPGDCGFYLIANAYHQPLRFALPPGRCWRRLVDTALPSPHDLEDEAAAPPCEPESYLAAPNSVVVLMEGVATAQG